MQEQGIFGNLFGDIFGSLGLTGSGNSINDLFSLIAPLAGFGLAGPTGALAGLTFSGDMAQANYRNQEASRYTDMMFDAIERSRGDFLDLQQNLPGVSLGGQTFAPVGHTGNTLNLDGAFRGAERGLDFFNNNAPGVNIAPLNFQNQFNRSTQGLQAGRNILGGTGSRVDQLGTSAQNQAGQFAQDAAIGSVPQINTDLSAVQDSRLAGAGASSRERERQLMESLASRAPMSGGLEGIQRDQASASQEESINRALEAQQIVGQTRQEEFAGDQFNANLEAQRLFANQGIRAQAEGFNQSSLMAQLQAALGLGTEANSLEQLGTDRDIQLGLQEQLTNQGTSERNLQRMLEMFSTQLGLEQEVGNQDTERLMAALQAAFQQAGLGGQFTQASSGNETAGYGIIQPRLLPQDFALTSALPGLKPDIFGSG